ncbi:MAG: gliding motility-associated C-terminal domain-containing protein [Bacteroidia bacterium]|nr:gliding motility-associated C-terminal domain-containing protein [Bacteroidia bacterium]
MKPLLLSLLIAGLNMPLFSLAFAPDTLFCGDTLSATFHPANNSPLTDSLFVWTGNCVPSVRFDFTTASVPDGAEIFYVDIYGNLTPAGNMPWFGGNCFSTGNYFNDSASYPLSTMLNPSHCIPGFVEIYGRGLPVQDSIVRRNALPADFKLPGTVGESARLHLSLPPGTIGVLFVVQFQPNIYSTLNALWDCSQSCCITATGGDICAGDSLRLNTELPAPAYQWTGPNGFSSSQRSPVIVAATSAAEGWYVVSGFYHPECVAKDSVYIRISGPNLTISPAKAYVCEGSSLQLKASGATFYTWNMTSPGLLSASGPNATVAPMDSVVYIVTGMDANGCVDTAHSVIVATQIHASVAGQDPRCTDSNDGKIIATIFEGQPPFEIRQPGNAWASGLTLSGLYADTYAVEIRDARGCVTQEMITLKNPEPVSAFLATGDAQCAGKCDGELMILPDGGHSPYTFRINEQPAAQENGNLCPGEYEVQITDASGCEWKENFEIEDAEPFEIDLGKDRKVYKGERLEVAVMSNEPLESVVWHGLCDAGCEYYIYLEPDSSLMVYATAYSPSGCTAKDSVNISVKVQALCNQEIYVPTAFSPNGDGINDRFAFYADREKADVKIVERLMIYNRWGNKIFDRGNLLLNDTDGGWDGMIQGNSAAPGVYTWAASFLREDNHSFECGGTVTVVK